MADEIENEGGGVGVVGGIGSVALGTAAAGGVSRYKGGTAFEALPDNVKSELTKEKIEAAEKKAVADFEEKAGKKANTYLKTIKPKAEKLKRAHGDKLAEHLAKDTTKMDAHEKAAITEYVKHDAKAEGVAEKVYEAGKKAHVEEHVTKQEKGLINAIEKQLKGAATKAGKEVPKAEDLTKKAEKIFKDNKQFAKSGVVGKTIAGFRGLGTGGKIGTTLLGVAVAATAGMAISSMRKGSGSHVEQLQQSRAEAQVAPAPAR